ncbi:MAG: glycosyltransferase family 4 protein [Methanosarcinales archaeon]|nr:glycosyltransferase family 4 protein [Methanosarcinales archaeon]
MNILIVAPYFYPEGGGLEKYAYNVAKGLAVLENEVTVICYTKLDARIEQIGNISVIRRNPDIIISNTPVELKLLTYLIKEIKTKRYDVVIAHTPVPFCADIAAIACRLTKARFILTYHNDNVKDSFPLSIIALIYNHTINYITLLLSNYIITSSPYCFEKSKSLRHFKHKLAYIPPAVDDVFFTGECEGTDSTHHKYSMPEGHKVILFVGQLQKSHSHKGIKYLLEGFKMALDTNPCIHLLIVGDGDSGIYKKTINEMNVESNVTFAGHVDNDEMLQIYRDSDILVLPTITPAEGFGMVLIEAAASETPVIGSDIGGISYVIKDLKNGVLVRPKSSIEIASAIHKLLDDAELYNTFKRCGFDAAKKRYRWNLAIDAHQRLLTEMDMRL